MGLFLGTLGWRDTTHKSIGSPGWWILAPIIVGELLRWVRLEFKDLESLQEHRNSRPSLVFRNKSHPDQTSDSAADRLLIQAYSKIPVWILIWDVKKPVLQVTNGTSKSVSFAENNPSRSLSVLGSISISVTPIPPDINKEFSSVFSESQADILPAHRSFDCTINLSSSAEPSYGRIYQLTREEDKEGDEPKTAFITKYGQFEFLVMPSEDHKEHVRQVLQVLKDNNLFCKAEKCHFYQTEIKYLGYSFHQTETAMDPSKDFLLFKIGRLRKKVRELQVFLGFTTFTVLLYLDIRIFTCHLTKLLKKDVPFSWGPEQEASFKRLKDAFAQPGFLAHPNDEQPFILETDASDFAISGVLHQHDQSNTLRPVAFYSRQMNNAERNYDIYDKELLAVVEVIQALETLVASCYGGSRPHVLVHSTVLDKVFVQEADWPLIIADFLAGEDNVWIEEISEDWLELCKKELKNFRFRDNTFVRILNDGKSTATYMPE
ncbi:transposon Tf2-11 polyprotein [Batrachochytrium salamandrivorans]|nr:transposon Tf2-11 polyprotein [Batrachochytrium salamandrivorans]